MAASQQQAAAASSAAGVSGPGSSGGPGPQQQPQPPAQLVGPAQSGLLQQQQQDFDPVQRYKMLIPQLKESLQTLMKVAAQNLIQNTNIDNGQKSSDGPIQRFDKCLEEFYALCDQLELCLEYTSGCQVKDGLEEPRVEAGSPRSHQDRIQRLAHECLSQSCDSAKHSPTLVPTATKPDAVQPDSLPYPQYLAVIKAQIACAKDIHTALLDCANKVTGKTPAPPTGPGGTL
ncbi:mediator of RNA polymerase II transcription subunit 29 isoform X1 [Canis aureus]